LFLLLLSLQLLANAKEMAKIREWYLAPQPPSFSSCIRLCCLLQKQTIWENWQRAKKSKRTAQKHTDPNNNNNSRNNNINNFTNKFTVAKQNSAKK